MHKPYSHMRVIGIDPSTSHMGISILELNILTQEPFKLIYANTLHGDKVNFNIPNQFDDDGKVQSRILGLTRAYTELLDIYNPDISICEDNYLGADPSAFKRLIEVVTMLKLATSQHNTPIAMHYVLPNLAKAVVKANFRGTKKEDVAKGILEYANLDINGFDVSRLDEHGTDAIAIGLYMCEKIIKDFNVKPKE